LEPRADAAIAAGHLDYLPPGGFGGPARRIRARLEHSDETKGAGVLERAPLVTEVQMVANLRVAAEMSARVHSETAGSNPPPSAEAG
jgi:hypothetical protein